MYANALSGRSARAVALSVGTGQVSSERKIIER
jgi:hypothetical protein